DSLERDSGLAAPAAEQIADYLVTSHAALGCLPTQDTIVLERFFDEAGGMQLVIHSPYGSRINRAWGLALRKRFCRKFNFELQAAATEDNIVLSLTTAHSFELAEAARYLHSASVRTVLIQALLDAPMFTTRWRWVPGTALALPRQRGGKKVPPQLARMEAEDLIGTVFPDQIACAENLVGERETPDHPLVKQTIADCLNDAMDISGLETLLARLESGEIHVVARDLTEPSPLALEVLAARPYAYLDDAPLEERRTQAVMSRRWLDPRSASDIGRLDPEAIARVRMEAWPEPANADEMHDALAWLAFLTEEEAAGQPGWNEWLAGLAQDHRAARLCGRAATIWIAAERLAQFRAVWPDARWAPPICVPDSCADREWTREEALIEILRGRLEGQGPVTESALAATLGLEPDEIAKALASLQVEGFAMRGRFTPGINEHEWCERRLLARIHRYTVKRLRAEIEPVAARDFLRFLFAWQRVSPETRMEGPQAVAAVIEQLEGFEAPGAAWETEILPARIADYEPAWLDDECLAGRVTWARLTASAARPNGAERTLTPVRTTPITLLARRHRSLWTTLTGTGEPTTLRSRAQVVASYLQENGASFFDEVVAGTGLLRPEVEDSLAELVALGLVTSDSFGGLRALLVPSDRRPSNGGGRRRRRVSNSGMEDAGRWALTRRTAPQHGRPHDPEVIEHAAHTLLR
ncbi:MAG: hypothetical protein JOZ58_01475, partial [Acetobacteraceae bacterium]|nr:hypothetical protein [Acetobacteraceae bacterium]